MEITGILTFIGIFISIVLILISIAYYGIKEPTYDETVAVNSNETKKKSKKETSNKKPVTKTISNSSSSSSSTNGGGGDNKKRAISGEANKKANNNVQEVPEEDPIVIIPDPFTMQLSSRFAGATKSGTSTNGGQNNNKKEAQSQQPIKVSKQQQYQKSKDDLTSSDNNLAKEIEIDNLGAFTTKTSEKVKPKATVKPNQNHVLDNANFESDFQIKTVSHNGALPPAQLNSNRLVNGDLKISKATNLLTKSHDDLVSNGESIIALANAQLKEKIKNMENAEMTFTSKLKELNMDLSEKVKQIDALNKANQASKNEIASLCAQMKDFEALKQTNQVIQKEMTKGIQNITNLENQKKAYEKREEAFRKDLGALQEKIRVLEASAHNIPSENLITKVDDSGDSASKLEELKSELSSRDAIIQNIEIKLNDSLEKSHSLYDRLKTQEALTKQLEIQLENQIKIVKQKDNEINALKLDGDSAQKLGDLNKLLLQQTNLYKQTETDLKNAQENITNLKNKINVMEATCDKYDALSGEKAQSDAKLNEIQDKNHSLSTSLENVENTNKSLNDSINKIKEEKSELEKKLNEANERLKQQEMSNSNSHDALKGQEELQSKKDEEIQNLMAKCKSLEDQLNDINQKLSEKDLSNSNNQESLKQQVELNAKKDEEIQNLLNKCKSLEDHLDESTNTVKTSNEKLEQLMVKFNETTSKYTESEVKTNEAITQKEESIQQREQEIKLLKGQLEQYLVNIASFEQEKKNLNDKLDESTRKLNEATESVSSQRELAERREHEVKELKEKIEKFDSENKLEEIKNLHSQINDLKQNEAQHEHASRESISQKDAEIKSLREKCEQIENANKHLNEQLKETSADKSQLVELTAKVQELEKKLNVSSNIINSLKTTKTTESTPDESARLKELIEENEDLKSKNFRLKSGLAVTEKSISQLEGVIKSRETSVFEEISNLKDKIQQLEAEKKTVEESGNKMIKKISKELKKEIDLRKELQKNADLAKVNGETNGTNGEAHVNGTNGTETNGTNGHHEATNFDSKVIDLMKENERLKQLLDEEIKSSKNTLSERARIRDLIKKGQDALEHEKQELHERFDDKILNEYELVNGVNGVNGNGINGNGNGIGSHTVEKI